MDRIYSFPRPGDLEVQEEIRGTVYQVFTRPIGRLPKRSSYHCIGGIFSSKKLAQEAIPVISRKRGDPARTIWEYSVVPCDRRLVSSTELQKLDLIL